MLQNLINAYEKSSPFRLDNLYDSEFVNYLQTLQKDTKKILYLEQRINNPQLSQKELAEITGVTPKTICEWQKDSLFNRVIIELSESRYRMQRTELIELLFSKAKEFDYKAIELFLKYTAK